MRRDIRALLQQVDDALGQDQLHRIGHLTAGDHQGIEAGDHGTLDQALEIKLVLDARPGFQEVDHHQALVRGRDVGHTEGVAGVGQGDALEIDISSGKLRANVIEVLG